MRDGRLGEAERTGEIAGAGLHPLAGQHDRQQPQPGRVRYRLEPHRESLGLSRAERCRPQRGAPAVGAYIGAAYWFTSSTSFANPAVAVGRLFSDTFAGIAPGSVPAFVAAELVGGAAGLALVHWFYPEVGRASDKTADDVVVPNPARRADSRPEPNDVPQVVFACVRNGGRSVISRLLTEHYGGNRVRALSAGTQPREHIHPEVADVLETLGLDTCRERPKLLTRDTIAASTVAITLGCGEECPYVPGVRYVDWLVDDPAGKDERTIRAIVGDLDRRVRDLLRDLVPDVALPPSVLEQHR
jgi:arsenate reductase